MPDSHPDFELALRELLKLATDTHDNSNVLSGQLFADDHGWLSDAEIAAMGERQQRALELDSQLEASIASISAKHREAWRAYVAQCATLFQKVMQNRAVLPLRARDEKGQEYDRLHCSSLVPAWQAFLDGGERKHSISWALSVGAELRVRYQSYF